MDKNQFKVICTSLESIIILGCILVIGKGAFSSCGIQTTTISDGIKVIGTLVVGK
jgi:hypothetical protein